MATIANLGVSLTARIGNFEKGFKRAQRIAGRFSSDIVRHTKTIAAFGAATVGVAAYATGRLVRQQLGAIDSTSKLSRVLGLATEELGGYQHAADLAGIDSAALSKGILKMNRTIADAEGGLSTAKRELDRVGLSAEALAGMSTDQRIKTIADRYSSIGDAAGRASFLLNVFGRAGAGMGNLFEQGADGIRAAQAEAARLGLTFTDLDGRQVEEANDTITRLQQAITGAATRIAVQLAPYIQVAAARLREFAMGWNVSGDAATNAMDFIANGLGSVLNIIDAIRAAWGYFNAGVLQTAASIGKIARIGAFLNPATAPGAISQKLLEMIGGGGERGLGDDIIKALDEAAIEAAERANEAFGRIFTGENTLKAQQFFQGVQIDAAKAAAAIEAGLVPSVENASAAASAKTSEFRQVDLSRIAIGGPTGKSGAQKVEDPQLKTTNSILREIATGINSPLVTA